MTYQRIFCVVIFLSFLPSGCASKRPFTPGTVTGEPEQTELQGWWNARFKLKWPEDKEPAWHVDLVLAHRVISPVLEKHRQKIIFWRFHRRALHDDMGHQFTFVFYTSQETAEEVFQMIASSPDLKAMNQAGFIVKETYDDSQIVLKKKIEAGSNTRWSHAVQKTWPYFIMGVSETWLRLVAEYAQQSSQHPTSVDEILTQYKGINDSVNRAWREEGGHAFLHHLNAVFGYEDITVYEKRLMTF